MHSERTYVWKRFRTAVKAPSNVEEASRKILVPSSYGKNVTAGLAATLPAV